MARYGSPASVLTTDGRAMWLVNGTAAIRVKIEEFTIGSADVADNACEFGVFNASTLGTTPAVSPTAAPIDPLTVAATGALTTGIWSADPTLGNELYRIGHNQRGPYRWVAYPGREFVAAAAANNGIAMEANNPSTAYVAEFGVIWSE